MGLVPLSPSTRCSPVCFVVGCHPLYRRQHAQVAENRPSGGSQPEHADLGRSYVVVDGGVYPLGSILSPGMYPIMMSVPLD